MIFFAVARTQRRDRYITVTDADLFVDPPPADVRLVAWNEAYPLDPTGGDPYRTLRDAVWAAARTDAVCQAVLAQLDHHYGLDPFQNAPAWWAEVVKDTLEYWAHPSIGNISARFGAENAVRPATYDQTWATCDFLDAQTKSAVQQAYAVQRPVRSARDQVRICYHIVDLARALVGELSCYVTKETEKLHALQLCASPQLAADLKEVLGALREVIPELPADFNFQLAEYLRYYLAGAVPADPGARRLIVDALWNTALGAPPANPPEGYDACMAVWSTLPPVIRLVALVNDIRRVCLPPSTRTTLHAAHVVRPPAVGGPGAVYRLGRTAEPVPLATRQALRAGTGWQYVDKWTRNERDPATRSARLLLAPTWGGSSLHVTKNLDSVRRQLGARYPASADRAIPAGLFALWRLYYDRRYSPSHTLVETCDGTTADAAVDGLGSFSLDRVGRHDHPDAYQLWTEATVDLSPRRVSGRPESETRPFVDGVALLEMLRLRHWVDGPGPGTDSAARIAAVEKALDDERGALTAGGSVVPRWSHELDPAVTGPSAAPFQPPSAPAGRRRRQPQQQN